jgi:SPP1 gp7 family putative phage head morphogenesis protein
VSSYKQGLLDAYLATRRSLPPKDKKHLTEDSAKWLKESFVAPEATKRIQLLAMRAFERMRDITETASSKLGQVLAQGMLDGSSPRAIAKEMVAQIDVLEAKRALVIARTEIVYAHAEGQLDGYEELGVQELGLQAEWSTAGDDRVCEECHPMEGKVFSVDQARGMIPLHPNCRCTWLPFLLAPPKG